MYKLVCILLLLGLNQLTFSQRIKIARVIDSNLFELKDSTIIKLAGVDMPRLDNPDFLFRKTAEDAVAYSKKNLLKKSFNLKVLQESDGIKLVYLIEKYPFGNKNHNLEFLKQGFGQFERNIDSSDLSKFVEAEQTARKQNKGIWKVLKNKDAVTLDREFTETEKNDPALTDSVEYGILTTPEATGGHVISEIILGPAVGIIIGIPTAALSVAAFADDQGEMAGFGEALLGWYTGYLIGNAVCIYAISNTTTQDPSIWGTIIASFIGGGLGIGTAILGSNSAVQYFFIAPLIFPVISSVLYVNTMAPDKYPVHNTSHINEFQKKQYTAVDFYNSTKIFEINLFRIQF